MDFDKIAEVTRAQRIRAWCVDKTIEHGSDKHLCGQDVINLAQMFEEYVTTGETLSTIAYAVEEGRIEGRFEVKTEVEEWFSGVDLDDLFKAKGWVDQKMMIDPSPETTAFDRVDRQ